MKRSSRAIAAQVKAAVISTLESTSSKRKAMMASFAATQSTSCQDNQQQQMQHLLHQRHSYHTVDRYSTKSSNENAAIIITPPPSPQLLLEGDEMHISSDGKSHTYYRLKHPCDDHTSKTCEYLLEEAYDIENARKEITLFQSPLNPNKNCNERKKSSITTKTAEGQLSKIFSFPLQEISNGMQKGAGTGSMTWESSIAMGLFFGIHPEELVGDVLELGSGVGLGGILTNVVSKNENRLGSSGCREDDKMNFTLTEVNLDIIDMLRYNTTIAAAANRSSGLLESDEEFQIEQMDWFDFLIGTNAQQQQRFKKHKRKKYDTIIASDCIYLHSQVRPLSDTITELLGRESPDQKAHIFSPHNRSFVHDLIENLREVKGMNVHVDTIEMSKMRVKYNETDVSIPSLRWLSGEDTKVERQAVVSNGTSKFLHIAASFKNDEVGKKDDDVSMTGID